jgi:hypothetical protein
VSRAQPKASLPLNTLLSITHRACERGQRCAARSEWARQNRPAQRMWLDADRQFPAPLVAEWLADGASDLPHGRCSALRFCTVASMHLVQTRWRRLPLGPARAAGWARAIKQRSVQSGRRAASGHRLSGLCRARLKHSNASSQSRWRKAAQARKSVRATGGCRAHAWGASAAYAAPSGPFLSWTQSSATEPC